jgi:hypothetical protein
MSFRLTLARSIHDINGGYDGPVICASTWRCFVDYFERIGQRLKIIEDSIAAQVQVKTFAQLSNEADPIEHTVVVLVNELSADAMGQVVGFTVPALLNLLFRLSATRDQDYAEVGCFEGFGVYVRDKSVFRNLSCRRSLKCPGFATYLFCLLKQRLRL